MGIFESKQTDQSVPAQCTVHVCTFQRETQQSVVICRGDRCRLSLFKESLKPVYMCEAAETFETWFKAFRGRMQHRLDIAYDYLYETSWSLQSLDRYCCLLPRPALTK
jgi:hypothetical protein